MKRRGTPEAARPRRVSCVVVVFLAVALLGVHRPVEAAPVLVEPGWTMVRAISFTNPYSVACNPLDGLPYVGRRSTGSDGVYRINADSTATLMSGGDRPAAVAVDPDDGDIFFSEDYGGVIYRVPFGSTGRSTWVSGFHSGDDDPIGIAIVPNDYTGGVVNPGEALSVDRGNSGPDEVWRWSPDTAEGETYLHADNGTLVDPVDIAANATDIYLVDAGANVIYEVGPGGSMTALPLSGALNYPTAIVFDPGSGDLLVLEGGGARRVVRVDPGTGAVSDVITGFAGPGWTSLDISPDGEHLFVADNGADTIYEFYVPEPTALVLLALGGLGVLARRRRT